MAGTIGYNILMWLLSLLGTIITSVVLPLIAKLLLAKIKSQKLNYVATELSTTIINAVDYTNQTFVEQLKADGKFDAESQRQAMNIACSYAFDCLTDSSKRIISAEGIDVYSMLERKIEAQIAQKKENKK